MSEFSDSRLATVFQAGRCIGFILLRGLSYEATDATGAVSLGFYPSQREAAAALQQSTSRPRKRSTSKFRRNVPIGGHALPTRGQYRFGARAKLAG